MKILNILLIIGAIFYICPVAAFSAIIHVPDDQPTIQAGIDAAVNGDTVLVADGTYTGDGNRDIDFIGKVIVVMSENGPEFTTIDCEGSESEQHRGFYFHSGEVSTSIVDGFTITGGFGPGDTDGESVGSGIKCDSASSPTIKNCVFHANELRAYGGGMYCENSSPILLNCTFSDNKSYTYNPELGYGAGLYCDSSSITLTGCMFTGNFANTLLGDGGGMYCTNSDPILNNCTFINNGAGGVGGRGGGLHSFHSFATLIDCYFEGNNAEYGGGMNIWGDSAIVIGCIFNENHAWYDTNDGGWGGGINCWDSYILLTNCTFSGNSANQYMGGYGGAININQSSVTLENCIIAFTLSDSEAISCYGSPPDLYCCDVFGNAEGDWVGCIADQYGLNGNFSSDPRFCDISIGDFSLNSSSLCMPENNDCDALIGAYGQGCLDLLSFFGIIDEDLEHVINHTPVVYWVYNDADPFPNDSFEVAVGTDFDWTEAEMWNPAPFESADTFVVYNGSPLIDGETYYLRLRVRSNQEWSSWYELSFRMNSVPSIPVPLHPVNNEIVDTDQPTLWIQNSTDAEEDTLTYDFFVVVDTTFSEPDPIYAYDYPEGDDSTGWQVTESLHENWRYWWRARAFDGYEYSDWSELFYGELWVNAIEEAPAEFQANYPPDTGYTFITNMLETFWWSPSSDPDPLDSVYYKLHISTDSNFAFVQTTDSIWQTEYTLIDSLEFGTQYWWKTEAIDNTGLSTFTWNIPDFKTWMLGDVNGNYIINILDVTFLIVYLYKGGQAPYPIVMGDVNGDCLINVLDISYLIAYLYKGGPAPQIGCE